MKNNGQFKKGMTPWNKGKTGYMGANRTSFTSEMVEAQAEYAVGEPQKPDKDGYITCRIEDKVERTNPRNGKKYYHRKRMSYAKYLAIKSGLEVPKGYVVYHKDGDSTNNDISNLEVISRAELIFRNNRELK